MIVVFVLRLAVPVLIAVFVVTQVMVPLWGNVPLFPMFRRRKLVKKLTEVRGAVDDAELKRQINEERARAAKVAGRK
jgi:hypothetical protein